jgi:cephalosporin hydroxylase
LNPKILFLLASTGRQKFTVTMSAINWFRRKPSGEDQGNEALAESPAAEDSSPPDLIEQSRNLYMTGEAAAGLKLAQAAVAAHPESAEALFVKANCLERVGRHAEANLVYEQALKLDPQHAGAQERHTCLTKALTLPVTRRIPFTERSWHTSLPFEPLSRLQNSLHNHQYRGVEMLKNPFDMALYPRLIWELKPRTIFEVGSKSGGSALWMGDLLNTFGIDGHILSLDIVRVDQVSHPRVSFMEGNGRVLGEVLDPERLKSLPRPWLVIEDADHEYETSIEVLKFFHPWLQPGEYIVVEDGIISDLSQVPDCNSGPHRALKEFLPAHPEEYEIDSAYCDFFGYNVTWCTNGWLRKTTPALMEKARTESLAAANQLLDVGRALEALDVMSDLKAERKPMQGLDLARARCFAQLGQPFGAIEALKEELRYFPGNSLAGEMLGSLRAEHPEVTSMGTQEFRDLLAVVRPYTMVGEARLWSLYSLAKQVCEDDAPGHFVECGVAGGGSSALIAAVIARHSRRPRKLFAFDSFEGMPPPSALDVHGDHSAEAHGWSTGTCAAPEASLREVCAILGVEALVEPIKGFFGHTLPLHRDRIGPIAFLHMDGDWYESTRDILVNVFDQVVPGSPIQVDDYGYWDGCRGAVSEFQEQRGLAWDLHDIDGTGVWFVK